MSVPQRKKPPTQADVARLAGVSRPMVSYALNNPSSVSIAADTRQRILDAVRTLGYVPDRVAQSLRTRKTHTIASIIPDITNPFYPTFQRGMQDVARLHNYSVITANTDGLREEENHCLEWVMQGFVDGAIFHLFHHNLEHIRPIVERGVVGVWTTIGPLPPIDLPLDILYLDNAKAAQTAVNFLIERGHTRIAMIAGQPSPTGNERTRGYQVALTEHHIPLDEIMVRGADFTERGGYAAMRELLELKPIPTAVFAANDLLAIGAMQAIHEAGLHIPGDVAIVGLDDIPAARLVRPALTTITQFADRFGQRAAQMIFERLANPDLGPLRSEEVPFELVIRDSA
jgi:LacI family transcriptional regulator